MNSFWVQIDIENQTNKNNQNFIFGNRTLVYSQTPGKLIEIIIYNNNQYTNITAVLGFKITKLKQSSTIGVNSKAKLGYHRRK